jgi:TolB-like protein
MKPHRFLAIAMCTLLCGHAVAQTQDIDKELSDLADRLAAPIKDSGKKKVTVIDFTDLQGGSSELGKYIADQLTVDLVMAKRDFAVLDRENLKSILAEHKLTAKGLVDPDNAKKLGQFAGVDAIILGSIVPRSNSVSLTARIITTDTAEIVGAAKAAFKMDDNVRQLLANATTEAGGSDSLDSSGKEPASVVKKFGDLRVDLSPLRISNNNDYNAPEFLATMALANQNPKKSIWVGLHRDDFSRVFASLTPQDGTQYKVLVSSVAGIQLNEYPLPRYGYGGPADPVFFPATELKPGDSITTTFTFVGDRGQMAAPGTCNLQIEILVGHDYVNGRGPVSLDNLVTPIEAK